jgi:hypothetical protein
MLKDPCEDYESEEVEGAYFTHTKCLVICLSSSYITHFQNFSQMWFAFICEFLKKKHVQSMDLELSPDLSPWEKGKYILLVVLWTLLNNECFYCSSYYDINIHW